MIEQHYPQIQILLDKNGNITQIEAKNYQGTQETCQGKIASFDLEKKLTDEGLIPQIKESDRIYKDDEDTSYESQSESISIDNSLNY